MEKLRGWYVEDNYTERQELDEFELILIADEIERAFKSKTTIKLTFWRDGQLIDDYGVPIEINITNKAIVIDNPFCTSRYCFEEIQWLRENKREQLGPLIFIKTTIINANLKYYAQCSDL